MAKIRVITLRMNTTKFRRGDIIISSPRSVLKEQGITETPDYALIRGVRRKIRADLRLEPTRKTRKALKLKPGDKVLVRYVILPDTYEEIGTSKSGFDIYYDTDSQEYIEVKETDTQVPEEVNRTEYLEEDITNSIDTDGHERFIAEVTVTTRYGNKNRNDINEYEKSMQTEITDFIGSLFDDSKTKKRQQEIQDKGRASPRKFISDNITNQFIKTGVEYSLTDTAPDGFSHITVEKSGKRSGKWETDVEL